MRVPLTTDWGAGGPSSPRAAGRNDGPAQVLPLGRAPAGEVRSVSYDLAIRRLALVEAA